jgi:hypothetical protein
MENSELRQIAKELRRIADNMDRMIARLQNEDQYWPRASKPPVRETKSPPRETYITCNMATCLKPADVVDERGRQWCTEHKPDAYNVHGQPLWFPKSEAGEG